MDLTPFVHEREADRAAAGESNLIGNKTIVLNGNPHGLNFAIATDREADAEQDKRRMARPKRSPEG